VAKVNYPKNVLNIVLILVLTGCARIKSPELGNWQIPEPNETTGVVFGVILDSQTNQPITGTPFLSKNISYNQPDLPPTIAFSYQYDPRAIVNVTTGEFYFSDVEPAENYVITILYGPGNSYIVREQDSEHPLGIKIEAGQLLDLGKILVEEP